jgi:hypothetical protein
VDQFVFDSEDDIWDLVQHAETEIDTLDDIGGQDFIDIMEAFQTDVPDGIKGLDLDIKYNQFNFFDVPPGTKPKPDKPVVTAMKGALRVYGIAGDEQVFVSNGTEKTVVGMKYDKVAFEFDVEAHDYFKLANTYSEEVGGKGVGLGFSNFLHSTAILVFAKNTPGVIEPHDGYDYAFDGITVEITGSNYLKRVTDAHIVISKYLIVGSVCDDLPCQAQYFDWSWKEDVGMIDSFVGTAFDTETTERSSIVSCIASLMPLITNQQRVALGHNFIAYKSRQPVVDRNHTTKRRDYTRTRYLIDGAIRAGAKLRDGIYMVPSPFRVLYPQDEPSTLLFEEIARRQGIRVKTDQWGASTYHTWNMDDDPSDVCSSKCEFYPEKDNYPHRSLHQIIAQGYKRYKSFTSAVIQAALLPKIFGRAGSFYDVFNRVGISWCRHTCSSLTWDCIYYTFSNPGPEAEVGKWHHDHIRNIYISPTFKTSRQDIHYAAMLPCKMIASLASCRPLLTPEAYSAVESKIMMSLCIQMNSTWVTSYRTGANRFLTCCHMSESGDLPSLIEGQLGHLKFHRFPDYFVMKLMLNFIDQKPSRMVTPLFRLPLPVMSYEKDFSQTLQWHMRKANHSTDCMLKVTEAARRHKLEETVTNEWMKLQLEYLTKTINHGTSKEEYQMIMQSAPDHPTMNIVMFIGMCSIVKDEIKSIGSIQHSMGLSVWSMMTDRHCTDYAGATPSGVPQIQSSRVVDAMGKYLRDIGGVTGAYELVAKMAAGSNLPPNYLLMHYKDSKESNREISQMYPQQRIKQCFPETLAETFTGNNEADQMSDHAKYNKHVEDTMDSKMAGKSLHASEDRSKFCQEQEPQLQALGLAAISYEAGSTSLRSAAAMTLMNKTRIIVYPHDADTEMLLGDMETGTAIVSCRQQKHLCRTLRIEKNMTQGLGAITAGAINTIYVTAQSVVAEKLIDGLVVKTVRTTSDDVKRSAYYTGDKNKESAAANFYYAPNRELNQAMMINNEKKFMPSEYMSEFNNVVATITGMIPQSPIFATLCVQPLLSRSIFGDIVTVVNASRSTMSWGCPPDTMQASLDGMIHVLRQKWLLNDQQMETLYRARFFPYNIAEHISGFWIRNRDVLKRVFNAFSSEQKESVLVGDVPLYDMLKRAELDFEKKKKRKQETHVIISGLIRANRVAEGVLRQRHAAERLMSRFIQPIPPKIRREIKERFFSMINCEVPDIDIDDLMQLAPSRVTVTTRATRRCDRMPTTIGTSARVDSVSLQRIRAARYVQVSYRDHLTTEEQRIVDLPNDEYDKTIARINKSKHYEGLSYKSPVGLPLTRLYDNTIFARPASFNFAVDIVQSPRVEQPFTFDGRRVTNFRPVIFGSAGLERITLDRNTRLAFGYGYMNNEFYVFYKGKRRSDKTRCVLGNPNSNSLTMVSHGSNKVYYSTAMDASPLLTFNHGSETKPYLPGLIGSDDAILNYGFYCRSSQPSGFAIYAALFRKYKSEIPTFVMKHMPSYPFFPYGPNTTEIVRGRLTALHGYACVNKLRLTSQEHPEPNVIVVLDGDEPVTKKLQTKVEYIAWG